MSGGAEWVTGISAAVSAATTFVLAWITYRYVKVTSRIAAETTASRRGSLYLQVERMMADVRPSRHVVRKLPDDISTWSPEEIAIVDQVSIVFQHVSYLWSLGLLDKELVAEGWGKTFIDTWEKIEPWVRQYRVETKAPNQRIHFERLVQALRDDRNLMEIIYPPEDPHRRA